MGVRTIQTITDDLDPEQPSAYRAVLGLNDVVVHLDLTSANYEKLVHVNQPFLTAGTLIRGLSLIEEDVLRSVSPTQIRRWALMNGLEIGPTGRIPRHLQQLYLHAEVTTYPVLGES